MADQSHTEPNNSNTAMAFILGAVVVVLGFVAWALWGDGFAPREQKADIEITLPDSILPDGGSAAPAATE